MDSGLTLEGPKIGAFANALSHFVSLIVGAWVTKFVRAATPAIVGTGVVLGPVYILTMRAIHADRESVEAWFENLRRRLQSGPVPIVEWAQPVMIGILYAVYGRTLIRRLVTSFCVGVCFTSLVFAVVYLQYKQTGEAIRQEKVELERETDPLLYSYVADPALSRIYHMALQTHRGAAQQDQYLNTGGIFDELRRRTADFKPELVQRLFANPDRMQLTPLFIIEGTYLAPGFQWLNSIFLFVFNVLLDFASVSIAIAVLQFLGRAISFRRAIAVFLYMLIGTLACATAAFFSYRLFFRGDTGIFVQLLVVLPVTLFLICTAIMSAANLIALSRSQLHQEPSPEVLLSLLLSYASVAGGVECVKFLWGYWHNVSFGFVSWKDVVSMPYILAATTLVPATLTLAAFSLMLFAKLTAEPARILPEAYMTFMKEEVGGTQAAGFIVLISVLVGVVVGLAWQ